MTHLAYLAFGSNQGNRRGMYREALEALARIPGIAVKARSQLYETEPIGLSDGGSAFLNAAIAVETDLSPKELMHELSLIEARFGKSPTHRSDLSRVIDLDLLLYADWHVDEPTLEVPHPRMHRRAFVLVPLAEIAPDAVHPTLRVTVEELKGRLEPGDLDGVCPVDFSESSGFTGRDEVFAEQG